MIKYTKYVFGVCLCIFILFLCIKGLPGTRVTGWFLVCTHNGDNIIQYIENTRNYTKMSKGSACAQLKLIRRRVCRYK